MNQEADISASPLSAKTAARNKNSALHHLLQHKVLYLMFMPGVIFLLINNYLPMIGVLLSFTKVNYQHLFQSQWSGLTNFKYLFATEDAWVITRNTVLYNGLFIILNLVFGVAFAILLNEIRKQALAKFYQSAIFLPYFLSMIVVSYVVLALLGFESGFINKNILEPLGFESIDWYSKPEFWPYILPIVNTWKTIGYSSVLFLAAIIGFDGEYYEAARIDGANRWQQIINITVPMLYPLMIITTLLAIGRIFYADFGLFFQVPQSSGSLMPTTNVLDTYVYRTFLISGDIGMSAAAGLYQAVVGFILVFGTNLVVRRFSKENALF